jgi:tRNA-modifying protein YgfZ
VVLSLEGKQIGDIRSSALSPRMGAIAMMMVRREVELESTVSVEGPSGTIQGQVVSLPFPRE